MYVRPGGGFRGSCVETSTAGRQRQVTVFAQQTQEAAIAQRRSVADQLRANFPKLAVLMDLQAGVDIVTVSKALGHANVHHPDDLRSRRAETAAWRQRSHVRTHEWAQNGHIGPEPAPIAMRPANASY